MVAAGAVNAAITRCRSPSWSPEKRSMMRYCIGLASGTGRLLHQLLHQIHGLFRGPVQLAEAAIARMPRGIDQERHGQSAHPPLARRFLLGIEPHRQRKAFLLQERLDTMRKLAVVHGDDLHRLTGEALAQALQRGQLVPAGHAPCRPEVDDDDAPPQRIEIHRATVTIRQREPRGRGRGPWLDFRFGHRGRGERYDRGRRRIASDAHGERQPISFEAMVYLKLSGSSESSRPSAVSLCGYIRNATLPLVELGRLRSDAVLYASQFISHEPKRRLRAASTMGSSGFLPPSSSRITLRTSAQSTGIAT